MKKYLKPVVHIFISLFGPHKINFHKNSLLILTYHRILPLNDIRTKYEQPGMVVSPETFEHHIKILKEYFDIVNLADWLEKRKRGHSLPNRACAITFDDGWMDNYEYAFPIIENNRIPVTIFIVSEMIGKGTDFWPGRLVKLLDTIHRNKIDFSTIPELDWFRNAGVPVHIMSKEITREKLDIIIEKIKILPDRDINLNIDRIYKNHSIPEETSNRSILNKDEIIKMLSTGYVDIGSHTKNHVRMIPGLTLDEINDQVINSKLCLENIFGGNIRLFCYPNGDTSDDAVRVVKQHYSGACTTRKGWNTTTTDLFLLKRISIHEDATGSKIKFLSKVSGWY